MTTQIGFGVLSAILIFSATRVVTSLNLVRSVLWLAVTLCATAVLFLMLGAPFIASIQLLLYTGGVITLMLFGIMLTNRETGVIVANERSSTARAALAVAMFLGVFASALFKSTASLPVPPAETVAISSEALGRSFLTEHVLAFEVLSVLLLAAMIGAVVLARREDPGGEKVSRWGRGAAASNAGALSLEDKK